eukprot:2127070-Alexandrium_andersonii.AAC.1
MLAGHLAWAWVMATLATGWYHTPSSTVGGSPLAPMRSALGWNTQPDQATEGVVGDAGEGKPGAE